MNNDKFKQEDRHVSKISQSIDSFFNQLSNGSKNFVDFKTIVEAVSRGCSELSTVNIEKQVKKLLKDKVKIGLLDSRKSATGDHFEYKISDDVSLKNGCVYSVGSKFFVKDSNTGDSFVIGNFNAPYSFFDGDEISFIEKENSNSNSFSFHSVVFASLLKSTDRPIVCRVTRDRQGKLVCAAENEGKYSSLFINVDNLDSAMSDAELVAIKILDRKDGLYSGTCVQVLGSADSVSTQVKAAIIKYGIPCEWSAALKEEIKGLTDKIPEKDKVGRVDLTALPLITIDGDDSRDFDDAVYCESKPDDSWTLYVAIADVSHYVRVGTELDREAYKRGNSVYFPDTVIPMLPEILSNGLCSLNPGVDRLCMVCEMDIDKHGQLNDYSFYPAVMHSHARMTYTKVHKIIEGDPELINEYSDIYSNILDLYNLYRVLDKARSSRGAIEFESEEVKFIFDENRFIEDIVPQIRNESHKLIEECMIMANVAAARFIESHNEETVFRIHPKPIAEKVGIFRNFIARYGLELGGGEDPETRDYANFLKQIEGREDYSTLNLVMLRSLAKAVYSPDNCGHFGLALKQYAHFTSPIRRYPDLMLHREIKQILREESEKINGSGAHHYEHPELDDKGAHCSETERRADESTYEVAGWLKCQFMEDKIGQEFECIITNVTSFGLFVMLENWHIDGLVYVGNLGNDFFIYDNNHQTLIGKNSKVVYKIGQKLRVTVSDIDMNEKRVNFLLGTTK